MRVVHRLGGCNGPFVWLIALTAGLAVVSAELAIAEPATDGSAAAMKDSATQAELDQHRKIDELQQQLLPLLRAGGNDAEVRKIAAQLTKEFDRRSEGGVVDPGDPFAPAPADRGRNAQALIADDPFADESLSPFAGKSQRAIAAMQFELKEKAEQLARYEAKIRQLTSQTRHIERLHPAPPIEGAVAQIFPLRHAKAAEAAGTLESLFGAQVRVAVDERTNSLVVSGKDKSLEAVRSLLQGLDESAVATEGGAVAASPDRTVLLRIFWLADGLPGDEGQDPSQILPQAVIAAMPRLGLSGPRLVTQTVNSLAIGDSGEVEFSTNVPAMLLGQHANLQCVGTMRPMNDDRAGLDMNIHVSGPAINCELKGSLATPLGHYMVLGTANSVIAETMTMAGGAVMGDGGMYSGGRGGEGGYGGADPAAAAPGAEGGMGMGGMAPQTPKYNTSRFAFVVQVIEGESFPAEK